MGYNIFHMTDRTTSLRWKKSSQINKMSFLLHKMVISRFVIAVEDGFCSLEKPFLLQVRISFHLANEASKQLLLICLLKCNGKNKYRWQYLTVMLVLFRGGGKCFLYWFKKRCFEAKQIRNSQYFLSIPNYALLHRIGN